MSLSDQPTPQHPANYGYSSKNRTTRGIVNPANIVAPAVSSTVPTLSYTTDSGASPLGTSAVAIPYNSKRVTYQGCVPSDNTTFGFRDNGSNGADSGGTWAVEFDYYGSSFVFKFRSFDTVGGTYQIYVDGAPIAASPFIPTGITVSAGGVYRMQVTFPSTALRRVRVQIYSAQYRGLEISPSDAVIPAPVPTVKGVVMGDSFVGGALNVPQQQVFTATLGRILGWEMVNAGQGGTAYTHNGPGARQPYNDPIRISTACAYNPDYVVIFGTVNDDSAPSGAAVMAAASQTYARYAALAPNTKLIVVGPPPQHTTIPAGRLVSQAAVRTAALTAPNVIAFIDPIAGTWQAGSVSGGDGQQWVTGTGYATATTGDGNSDWVVGSDNVHPTQAGHDYYARRIAKAIEDILATV